LGNLLKGFYNSYSDCSEIYLSKIKITVYTALTFCGFMIFFMVFNILRANIAFLIENIIIIIFLIIILILTAKGKFEKALSFGYVPLVIELQIFIFIRKQVSPEYFNVYSFNLTQLLGILTILISGLVCTGQKSFIVVSLFSIIITASDFVIHRQTDFYPPEVVSFLTLLTITFLISYMYLKLSNIIEVLIKSKDRLNIVLAEEKEISEKARNIAEKESIYKSEFIANMSHELRTPLYAIIGYNDLLINTNLTDEQKKYVEFNNLASETLLSIINDILDISKIESGKIILNLEPFNLIKSISDTIDIFRFKMNNNAIDLTIIIDENIPKIITGDEKRIRQIIMNLVSNAFKFTEQGVISVHVALENTDKDYLKITVNDTGIGIQGDKLNQIFSKFYQIDSKLSRKYTGTGLGLAISKKLVELMGGEIGVHSNFKEGSSFFFSVPINHPTEDFSNNEILSNTSEEVSGMNILLVEDNLINQLLTTTILEKLGCVVVLAENGYEAIKLFEDKCYDAILMDIQMPDMNGIETSKKIREMEITRQKRTPIIALTANAFNEDKLLCLNSGMDHFLQKPATKEEIRKALLLSKDIV